MQSHGGGKMGGILNNFLLGLRPIVVLYLLLSLISCSITLGEPELFPTGEKQVFSDVNQRLFILCNPTAGCANELKNKDCQDYIQTNTNTQNRYGKDCRGCTNLMCAKKKKKSIWTKWMRAKATSTMQSLTSPSMREKNSSYWWIIYFFKVYTACMSRAFSPGTSGVVHLRGASRYPS